MGSVTSETYKNNNKKLSYKTQKEDLKKKIVINFVANLLLKMDLFNDLFGTKPTLKGNFAVKFFSVQFQCRMLN